MASGTGQLAVSPANPAYVASKAALIGLTRQVAYDLAHANITVNTIAPGVAGTPEFYRNTSEEFRAQTARSALLNRLGTPEGVGRTAEGSVGNECVSTCSTRWSPTP